MIQWMSLTDEVRLTVCLQTAEFDLEVNVELKKQTKAEHYLHKIKVILMTSL